MKKLMMALLAVGLVLAFTQCDEIKEDNSVILSGKIENPNSETVVISIDKFPERIVLDTAFLDENGFFSTSFELCECKPIVLNDGKEVSYMYLCPGDSLYITLNTEEFDESIHFEGIGARKNNTMAEYYLGFKDFANEEMINFYKIKDTSIYIYIDLVNETADGAEAFFNNQKEQYNFPASFITYMETELYYDRISLFQYLFYGKSQDTTLAYQEKKNEIQDLIINAGQYENPDPMSKEYRIWVGTNLPMILSIDVRKEMEEFDLAVYDSLVYNRVQQYLSPEEFEIYLAKQAASYQRSYNADRMTTLKQWVAKNYPDQEFIDEIDKMFEEMVFKMNQPLPDDATLYNLDDEELLELTFDDVLAKYEGNVIYLDFWASWCGPCKAEMPNSAKLSKKLAAEDVIFLYVSTDKDAEAWENMIRIMQLHGIHYRLGENTRKPVFETFGIKFIPHYVIFDKEGNMVKNNMTRPSDPETEKMILELL